MSEFTPDENTTFDELDEQRRQQQTTEAIPVAEPDAPRFANSDLASDEDLANVAVQNQASIDDSNFPRFAMSGLLPIGLYRQTGNNSYADFNPKDRRTGINLKNHSWYPAFTLMPLLGGTFDIPFEHFASFSNEPTPDAPFDYNSFINQPREGFSSITRSARECSEIYLRENGPSGGYVFESLIGYHVFEADRGVKATRRLFETVLPYRDAVALPRTERVRGNVTFVGPFLDEMAAYVLQHGRQRLIDAGFSLGTPDNPSVEARFLREMQSLLNRAVRSAETLLNDTEAEMQNPAGLKKSYDPPDLEIDDAPVSTDLYCLAHINRIELDNKQLHASATIGSKIADPMTAAVEKMTETMERMGAIPAAVPTKGFSKEEVAEMLATQAANFEKMVEEKVAAAVASASASQAVSDPAQPPAGDPPAGNPPAGNPPASGRRNRQTEPK